MLQVNGLTKRYKQVLANDNVTFEVLPGEITVLAGPNGAGKSTAIKCIAGLLRYQGSITIGGFPAKSVQAKRLFGYVPELPVLFETLTVGEHLEFVARAYQVEGWEKRAAELLDRFEMADKQKKLGKELSKGMQQKLSICCALLPSPQVVLFDEPLVGLDPHAIKELKTVFREMREGGASVLISTHMLDSVNEFWDKVLIMMNGRIAAVRTRVDIAQSGEDLEDLFFSITESRPDGSAQAGTGSAHREDGEI